MSAQSASRNPIGQRTAERLFRVEREPTKVLTHGFHTLQALLNYSNERGVARTLRGGSMETPSHRLTGPEEWQIVRVGTGTLRFYLAHPAPTQWVAVGMITTTKGAILRTGVGRSARLAYADLVRRVSEFLAEQETNAVPGLTSCAA